MTTDKIVEIYKDDLPTSNNCQEEFIQWKKRWSDCDISERPLAIGQALKQCENGVSEIRDGEDVWQWSRLEIRLNAFRQSTIPQKQFIIIITINDAYPNLSVLLKIAGTVPVTSCECERSGSILKRLNTYLRASMRYERLSGLALMQINYDLEISVDRVNNFY